MEESGTYKALGDLVALRSGPSCVQLRDGVLP